MRLSRLLPLLLIALSIVSLPARADEWRHHVAPYIWGANLDADVTLDGTDTESDVSFGDILDHLEMAAMLRYEGKGERWGVMADVLYLGLGFSSASTPAEVDVDFTVLELEAAWHANEHLEVLFGARYYDLAVDADFESLPDADASEEWLDGVVGLRVGADLSPKWHWYVRGDIGAGGSDLAWNVETCFVWQPTDHFDLAMGYRALATDYETGSGADEFELDAVFKGPVVGFVFKF